jgi:glycosyltransferase involved in cell wall biosynthesis
MHLLFLTKWYPNTSDITNGIFIESLALQIAKNHKVTVIALHPQAELDEKKTITDTQNPNYRLIQLYFRAKEPLNWIARWYNLAQWLLAFVRAWKILKNTNKKPDLVHVHVLTRPAVMAYGLKLFYGIPYVITEHWSRYLRNEYKNKNLLYKKITSFVAARAKAFTCVSERLMQELVQAGIHNQIMQVIPNMVDVTAKTDTVEGNRGGRNTIFIATVSDLVDKTKNISSILYVLSNIKPIFPAFEYHLVGDGPDAEAFKQLVEQLKLTDKVFFHGRQDHDYICSFLPVIDFLVTNSYSETFSIVTAEALSLGKPVIATRCGGPESYINEGNGILIDVDSPRQLEDALLFMIKNCKNYSPDKLRASVRQFSPEIIVKQYNNLYQMVLTS